MPVSPTKIPFGEYRGWAGSCGDNHKKMNVGTSMLARALWFSSCEKKFRENLGNFTNLFGISKGENLNIALKAEAKNTIRQMEALGFVKSMWKGKGKEEVLQSDIPLDSGHGHSLVAFPFFLLRFLTAAFFFFFFLLFSEDTKPGPETTLGGCERQGPTEGSCSYETSPQGSSMRSGFR